MKSSCQPCFGPSVQVLGIVDDCWHSFSLQGLYFAVSDDKLMCDIYCHTRPVHLCLTDSFYPSLRFRIELFGFGLKGQDLIHVVCMP